MRPNFIKTLLPLFVIITILVFPPTPGFSKSKRALISDEELHYARNLVQETHWAKDVVAGLKESTRWLVAMSDEEIWSYIPDADLPRAYNVHFGSDCPIHGNQVNRKGGHYPWITDRKMPFKVKCPVGGEIYPSNDFAEWYRGGRAERLDTQQKYVDDGWGYVDERKERYWFVGYYATWQLWQKDILPGVRNLALLYLLTGDVGYGHKAAVILARIAEVYPNMDASKQVVMVGRLGYKGGIFDHHWEPEVAESLATAYDYIYEVFNIDSDLEAFLKSKSIENVREYIENRLLLTMIHGVMEKGTIHGNEGGYQNALATLALVCDNSDKAKGITTKEIADWIWTGKGGVNDLLWNGIYRDGHPAESSPSYSAGWFKNLYSLASKLKLMGIDMFSHPRMKKLADVWIDMLVAGQFTPDIGDSGSLHGQKYVGWDREAYEAAYEYYRDPKYAKVVTLLPPKKELFKKPLIDKVGKRIEKEEIEIESHTRNFGGYGLATLESGRGVFRRGVSMYYGCATGGHGHLDRLNIEFFAKDRVMLPEMGYPTPKGSEKEQYWTANTISHNLVTVNQKGQENMFAGHLNMLSDSPVVKVMDASAEVAYPKDVSLYQRRIALIDVSPEDSYLVDIFRVKGGTQHDLSFHGPPFPAFKTVGLEPSGAEQRGTLAGEDIAFGQRPSNFPRSGFQYLFNIQRAKPQAGWIALWMLPEERLHLKLTMPHAYYDEVIVANAESELTPGNPNTLKYLIVRNQGERLDSKYVSVIEAYKDKPLIEKTLAVETQHNKQDAIVLKIVRGTTNDYVISSPSKDAFVKVVPDIDITGEFGVISESDNGLGYLFLVHGKGIKKGPYALHTQDEVSGKILRIDYEKNTITLDKYLPNADLLIGSLIFISNNFHKTTYAIKDVRQQKDKTIISLGDVFPLLMIGEVSGIEDENGVVSTNTRLDGYGRVYGGNLGGMALVNEGRNYSAEIISYSNGSFKLAPDPNLSYKFKDANGDGKVEFYIYDFRVEDDFSILSSAFLQEIEPYRYYLKANFPTEISIKKTNKFDRAYYKTPQGSWKELLGKLNNGMMTFSFGVEKLRPDGTIFTLKKPMEEG